MLENWAGSRDSLGLDLRGRTRSVWGVGKKARAAHSARRGRGLSGRIGDTQRAGSTMADVESRGGGDESTPLMAGKAAGRGGAAGGSRDAHLDNCKFWLMCAVVANHCFQDFFKSVLDREAGGRPWCQPDVARDPIGAYALARGAYMYLNLLGMPAFTLVSGICSRSLVRCATAGDGAGLATRSRRMVESLLVPYVIWQTVFLIYGTYGTREFRPPPEHPVPFVSPVGVTWYLTALFAWRCSVQFIATLRNVVAVTFIVGLAVGFVDTPQTENGGLPFLDYQRAVAFAPMFYVGATALTEDVMSRLTSKGGAWVRHVGWAVTVATPVVFTAVLRGGGVCFDEAQRWAWTMVRYVRISIIVFVCMGNLTDGVFCLQVRRRRHGSAGLGADGFSFGFLRRFHRGIARVLRGGSCGYQVVQRVRFTDDVRVFAAPDGDSVVRVVSGRDEFGGLHAAVGEGVGELGGAAGGDEFGVDVG